MFGTRQGTSISNLQAKQLSTYTSNGWSRGRWTTNGNTTYPKLIPNGYDTFDGQRQGTIITHEQATKPDIYIDAGWSFAFVWEFKEGVEYPQLYLRIYKKIDIWKNGEDGYCKVDGQWKRIIKTYVKQSGKWQ